MHATLRSALLPLVAAALVGPAALSGCADNTLPLRAYRAESPAQLIGGDVAMARVGDFILENDKIRVAILGSKPSPGPGVFGGTLVDADLQRRDARFRGGNGRDSFAEMFPFANLLSPRPDSMDISILEDGSSGERAVVRVAAEGEYFLEALQVLRSNALSAFFPNVKMYLTLQTDYILEPGASYVRMVTTVRRADPIPRPPEEDLGFVWGLPSVCDDEFTCDLACPDGYAFETDTGCAMCECAPAEPWPLANIQESRAVFDVVFGSGGTTKPGVVAGDFVFFGAQNDLFAPGIGYDEDKTIFDLLFQGSDPFTTPLEFDYMAASGGAVSYGYFTANPAGEPDPQVLVPIITSSATAFVSSAIACPLSPADPACDAANAWTYERYFAIGQGDVASVQDIVHAVRGTATGTLAGVVLQASGSPAKNGHVFVFHDPDPARDFADVFELADTNFRDPDVRSPGLLNTIGADVGLDAVEDGDFSATMPPGTYLVAAMDADRVVTSALQRVTIEAGKKTWIAPILPKPARLKYRIVDGQGAQSPGKLTLVPYRADATLHERDGTRAVFMGIGRRGQGIRYDKKDPHGAGELLVEPGHYRLTVSRGPEFSTSVHEIEAVAGRDLVIEARLVREVDTAGWIAGDFHLHAEPSFDSGLELTKRIANGIAEGLEMMVATDHDVVTNYAPTVREMDLEDQVQTEVGVELSTLELGHFIAFPVVYDDLNIPDHGAPDWACKDGVGLIDELDIRLTTSLGVKILAHPRDGFIGYISQLEVNPFDLTRGITGLESSNVLLSRSTCDFDAMEVFNAKRFDLVRTPSLREIILFNRCSAVIDGITEADGEAALIDACHELPGYADLAPCRAETRFYECKQRYRRHMAYLIAAEILRRTPEEQAVIQELVAARTQPPTCAIPAGDAGQHEDPLTLYPDLANQPCDEHPGTYDDWMSWLDRGMAVTLTGASDSHGEAREPGTARAYVRSDATTPRQIDPEQIADEMTKGAALATYGPIIDLSVQGKLPGETATVAPGEPFTAKVRVQTASWFGVDRVEVYVSGELQHVAELDHGPERIVDFEEDVQLTAPDRDGFVSVVALGTRPENLFGPVYLDVAFGELQLPRVASMAFGAIDAFKSFFPVPIAVPDFFPVFPMATTNAVYLDTDGDGAWAPPGPLPEFCPRGCDPEAAAAADCPTGQTCLPVGVCGIDVPVQCRTASPGTLGPWPTLME